MSLDRTKVNPGAGRSNDRRPAWRIAESRDPREIQSRAENRICLCRFERVSNEAQGVARDYCARSTRANPAI